ncbi:iron ABC transporter substrate-binding protein [Methanosarcina sp. 2.H.T.1A.6]|nr:iron ABC transporter substrate-binding protein [Methanosarcina sp. 2.H.T.1A.3]KKG16307.1 iron ABC transporter substrate-binding protein [Methanosarcina sp. 2.H.T.1A.15]KKG22182.1 iron ABC transporter substrate-binding protein [Methanosarcina sp. 2.H.T.1A.8]KKG24536.1 iron ABC transporter substrate-binding protein [Methanosarcina sp. 2.H.T.1A.6]
MTHIKKLGIVISALLLILLFVIFSTATEQKTNKTTTDTKIIIIDALGREVTLDKPAERIAYTHYSVAEVLKAVGAWDRVVARDGYISDENFYPNLDKIPAICPARNPMDINYEKTIETQPDVLILPKFEWYGTTEEIINALEPDIPVVFVDTLNPDSFCDTIKIIGMVTGNEEEAQEYIEFYSGIYDPIVAKTSQISQEDRFNVFYKAFSDTPEQIKTYGKDMPGGNEFFNAAGGKNIAGDLSFAYGDVDKEWVLEQDIDAIVVMCWDQHYLDTFGYAVNDSELAFERGKEIQEEIMRQDVFAHTDAVKNKKVYLLHNELLSTPRNIIAIAYMAKWFYPEEFPDLDPEALHQEYLDRFIKADYNLSNAGLFAYPA